MSHHQVICNPHPPHYESRRVYDSYKILQVNEQTQEELDNFLRQGYIILETNATYILMGKNYPRSARDWDNAAWVFALFVLCVFMWSHQK